MAARLLIFDFDGTLADSFGWFLDTINTAAAQHGFDPLDLTRLDDDRGLGGRELMARLRMPLWKVPAVTASMRRAMHADIHRIHLFGGALPLLRTLRARGVRIAVVSSNTLANVQTVLGADGTALVDRFACGASIFGKKPLLQRVVNAEGLPRTQVLCVGDERRDAEAAAAAGLAFVGVAWGYATADALAAVSPHAPVTTFDALLAFV